MKSKNLLWVGLAIEVASILATLLSAWFLHESAEDKTRMAFERQVDRGMQVASARLSQYNRVLDALAALIYSSQRVTLEEWRSFVETLKIDEYYPGVSGFGLILKVKTTDLEAFVAAQREEFRHEFRVKYLDDPQVDQHFIISKIEPLTRNSAALGLDVGSNVVRREACIEAMDTGETRITRSIILVQDQQQKPGFLMLHPCYREGVVPKTIEERRAALLGWTYSPFVGERVMDGIGSMAGHGLKFSIYDGSGTGAPAIFDGIAAATATRESIRTMEVAGREWRFRWIATEEAEYALQKHDNTSWVLLSGIITSTGLLLVMWLLHLGHRRAINAANEALKAKRQFLSVMSHEIRTPINGIIGLSDLLQQEQLEGNALEIARTIRVCGDSLLGLVNNVLDLSRIQENSLVLESVAFDARVAVTNAMRLLNSTTISEGVATRLDLPPGSVWVKGDPLRFGQIVLNLVSNAYKFTEKGHVEVGLKQAEPGLVMWVADTGIGMDEDTVSKVFDPFTQADASITRKYGGSGLGLAIVKDLVQLMGGMVKVTSKPGEGCHFELHLPLPDATPSVNGIAVAHEPLGLKVLLVEDNPVNQMVAMRMLDRLGCSYQVAEHGGAALDWANREQFDVILMDCQMPVMSGAEACKRLRSTGVNTPIVAFTANIDEKDACHEAGMNGFLIKPVRQSDLLAALRPYQK